MPLEPQENPYPLHGGVPKLRRSVVAFIDLLGSRAATRDRQRAQPNLEALYKALNSDRAHRLRHEQDSIHRVATFTDNLVVGVPLDLTDDHESELHAAMWRIQAYQLELAINGFFHRGGLVFGDLWMGDGIVLGEGLNAAYELESRIASVPRVVLSDDVVERVRAYNHYYAGGASTSPWNHDVVLSIDGHAFINYLHAAALDDDLLPALQAHHTALGAALFDSRFDLSIAAKYEWLAQYHNWFSAVAFPGRDDLLLEATPPMLRFRTFADDEKADDPFLL